MPDQVVAPLPSEAMMQELKSMRARHLELIKQGGSKERRMAICRLYKSGYGLRDIADLFQVSRERIRVLIRMSEQEDA